MFYNCRRHPNRYRVYDTAVYRLSSCSHPHELQVLHCDTWHKQQPILMRFTVYDVPHAQNILVKYGSSKMCRVTRLSVAASSSGLHQQRSFKICNQFCEGAIFIWPTLVPPAARANIFELLVAWLNPRHEQPGEEHGIVVKKNICDFSKQDGILHLHPVPPPLSPHNRPYIVLSPSNSFFSSLSDLLNQVKICE